MIFNIIKSVYISIKILKLTSKGHEVKSNLLTY